MTDHGSEDNMVIDVSLRYTSRIRLQMDRAVATSSYIHILLHDMTP